MYCPGALHDDLYGGAKPIIMPTGGSTVTITYPALVKAMTLDIAIEAFDAARREALTLQLAVQYGVHPSLVTLQATPGSLQLTITIATTNGTDAAVPIDIETLRNQVKAVRSTALAATISQVMSTNVTITELQPLANSTVEVTREFSCQRGQWHVTGELEPSKSCSSLAQRLIPCTPRSQV
jgi:hypothetical protein